MKRVNNNKGVSLIEIIVALAIMALLMTAVINLMSQNTIIFRKTKNDLKVQTQAEETFTRISDVIMQSKYIYIEGYTANGPVEFKSGDVGLDTSSTVNSVTAATAIEGTGVSKFSDIDMNQIYLKKMVVVATVPIDNAVVDMGVVKHTSTGVAYNSISSHAGAAKTQSIDGVSFDDAEKSVKYTNNVPSFLTTSANHNILVGDADRCIYTFYFYKNDIYMTTQYMYMKSLDSLIPSSDDPKDWDNDVKSQLRISNALNYLTVDDDNSVYFEGAVATFDSSKDCVGLALHMNDTHMTYTVNNILETRNPYVISEFKGN